MVHRRHPRFVTEQQVELEAEDRNELRAVWMTDISKGGLFVETDDPPPLRTRVVVGIETPEGRLELAAEVVHIVAASSAARLGINPGVGLQFVDLSQERQRMIEAYVEGLTTGPLPPETNEVVENDQQRVIAVMKAVLAGYETEDLYRAIDIDPMASDDEVAARITEMSDVLNAPAPGLSAAQQSRARHVQSLLRRIRALLTNPDRRLDYDLRHGHLFPRHRLAEADPAGRERLRRIWHRNNPGALPQAEKHASLALRYEGVMKYREAIEAATEALKYDPFNEDIWRAVDTWKARQQLQEESFDSRDLP